MAKLQPSIQHQKLSTSAESEAEFSRFQKKTCRYCDAGLSEPFLDLGISPLANSLPLASEVGKKEFACPLRLVKCPSCHLVQLSHVVPGEMMFSNYLYVSSTTQTFRDHFSEYAKQVKNKLTSRLRSSPNDKGFLAVDIGSNDGLLVSCYKREGLRAVGVEPAENLSKLANENGQTTINRFFDAQTVDEIIKKYGRANVVSGNNVFAHIDNVQDVCRNVCKLLAQDGMLVLEFPYFPTMIEEMLFDMIYHEHLSYISVLSLTYLLNRFDLKIFDIDYVSSHGGSLRVFIEKSAGPYPISGRVKEYTEKEKSAGYLSSRIYQDFAKRVYAAKENILKWVCEAKQAGKTISGYGAPAKATTLTNFCGFSCDQIDYVVDDNPMKQNHLVPGTKIPIVPSDHLFKHPTDYVILFAWNFAPEILKKLAPLKTGGTRFMIPLPSVQVL